MFDAIRRVRISEQVAESIRRTIIGGRVTPGDRLPSERDLAAQFGVNRASVREALKILEQDKLVAVHHGGGADVIDFWSEAGLDLLPALLFDGERLNERLVDELHQARSVFCREMARLGAERASPELLDQLADVLRRWETTAETDAIQQLDFEFFHLLSWGCGNKVFVLMMNMVHDVYFVRRGLLQRYYQNTERLLSLMRELVAALRAGDPERAVATVDELFGPTQPGSSPLQPGPQER
ncbi:MAG: FadR family transcriptional regulator [Myxococcales bacterium]|nr:FadR family transcriptional regulator [Myxococcales bacterium]